MKYKVGDEICLKAKITSIATDALYPYNIDICLGDNWGCNDYACQESAIVNLVSNFKEETATVSMNENKICDAYIYDYKFGLHMCSGTKEMDACSCGGDQSKCDFYETVRNKSKERIFTIAEATDQGTLVTAEMYQAVLKDIQKLQFYEIMAIFKWSDYEAPLNKESCLEAIVKRYTPKEVVDAYEHWKFTNTVNVGDVIYLDVDKKEYLVTNIVRQNGIVQYHMIAKDFCVSLVGYSNVIEQMPSNAFTKIKSNETIQNYLYGQEE